MMKLFLKNSPIFSVIRLNLRDNLKLLPMEITLLYASLLSVLAICLAFSTGLVRSKTNTMLGEGDSPEMLQSIRAFGNLIEYAPLAIIMLGLLEIQDIDGRKLHILGSTFFLSRILHAYGLAISRESTPYRLLGTLGTWITILAMAISGIVISLPL